MVMVVDITEKERLKKDLVSCLAGDSEIVRVVVFGSFLHSTTPSDMDVAIFQDSQEPYLPLAMKYRRQTRRMAARIALDIIPLRADATQGPLLSEIHAGELLYERRS